VVQIGKNGEHGSVSTGRSLIGRTIILSLLAVSMALFSCTSTTYEKAARVTAEERKDELLAQIHTARMEGDLKGLRKLCKDYLKEFPDDAGRKNVTRYLIEADISLKFYTEAESYIDSLAPGAEGDELAVLNTLKSEIDESRGDYFEASMELLRALDIKPSEKIRGDVLERLERLAPLLGDNERRKLINEFVDVDGVSILIDESLRFASEIGDTASVRLLSGFLSKFRKRERTPSPFEARRIVIPRRIERKSTEAFKVGILCPLSGRLSPIGHEFLRGATVVLREAMLARGINMELIVADTKGDPLVAMKETTRLIEREGVHVIVGAVLSSTTISAAIVAQEHGIVFLSPLATAEGISEIGDRVFQLESSTEAEVIAVAEVATKVLRLRRIAVMAVADERAFRITKLFRAEVERFGGEVVTVNFYEEGKTDFKDYIELIRSSDPDGLFIPSDTEDLILILPQLSFYEFGVRLLGLSNWNSDRLLKMVSRDMEGAVFPGNFLDDYLEQSLQSSAAVINEPLSDINPFLLGGYRGVKVIVDVLARSSSDMEKFFDMLSSFLNNRENMFLTIARDRGIPMYTILNGKKVVYTELKIH